MSMNSTTGVGDTSLDTISSNVNFNKCSLEMFQIPFLLFFTSGRTIGSLFKNLVINLHREQKNL